MNATLTIFGLYQFDNTVLDGIILPDGMDFETLRDNLIAELGNLELLYPSAPFMKTIIAAWAKKEKKIWDRQYATQVKEYDMLKNYDVNIEEEINDTTTHELDTENSAENTNRGSDTTETINADDKETHITQQGTDTTTKKTAAFNSAQLAVSEENDITLGSGNDANEHVESAGTVTVSLASGNDAKSTLKGTNIDGRIAHNKRREYGDASLRTTQEVLALERKIALYNVYDLIIDSFKNRFCLLIY